MLLRTGGLTNWLSSHLTALPAAPTPESIGSGAAATPADNAPALPEIELGLLLLFGLLFYVAPWPLLYGPAAIGVLILAWRRLDLALLLVVAFAPAFMQPKHVGAREFPPSEVFLAFCVLIAATWLLSPARRTRFRWNALRLSPFLFPAIAFLVAATLSTALSADHAEGFRAYREVIVEPVIWVALMLLVGGERVWRQAFAVLVAAGVVIAVIALGQVATGNGLSTTGSSLLRARALYGSPDNLGLFFDRAVPISLAVLLSLIPAGHWLAARTAALRATRERPGVSIAWAAASVLMLAGVIASFSRGAWAAIAGAVAALLALRGWWRPVAAVLLVGAVAAGIIGGPRVVRAFRAGHANSVQQRLYLWQSAIQMIRDHPLAGIGPDNFVHYFAPTRKENLWQRECTPGLGYIQPAAGAEPCLSHPHNEVLDFWLSTGIVGLAAFVWLQVIFWMCAWSAFIRSAGTRAALLVGGMAAMLAALLHGLVDNSYFLEDLSLIFWLLCGYVSFVWTMKPHGDTGSSAGDAESPESGGGGGAGGGAFEPLPTTHVVGCAFR